MSEGTWPYVAMMLVREDRLTEGAFRAVLGPMGDLPDSWVPDWTPERPGHPLFSSTVFPTVRLCGMDFEFDSSGAHERGHILEVPSGIGVLTVLTDVASLEGNPANQDAYLRIIDRLFDSLGATYGAADHMFAFESQTKLEEFLRGLYPVHMFSDELADAVGVNFLRNVPARGTLGGRWRLRLNEDITDGMPERTVRPMYPVIDRLASGIDLSSVGGGIPPVQQVPRVPMDRRQVVPGRERPRAPLVLRDDGRWTFFFWCHYPRENHTIEACTRFYLGLVDVPDAERHVDVRGLRASLDVPMFDREAGIQNIIVERSGTSDEVRDRMRRKNLSRRILHLYAGYADLDFDHMTGGGPPLQFPRMVARFQPTSGFRLFGSHGPQFERPGSLSALLLAGGKFGELERSEDADQMRALVTAFCESFRPTFGFGHPDFRWFVGAYQGLGEFEAGEWPVTVVNTKAVEGALVERLRRRAEGDPEGLELSRIGDDHLMLHGRRFGAIRGPTMQGF